MSTETRILAYDEFVEAMLDTNWRFMDGRTPAVLTEKDTKFISIHPMQAGGFGRFLELRSPAKPMTRIAINSMNQRPSSQHRISIRCRDDTGFELPGRTQISLMKLDSKDKPVFNTWLTYNEISITAGSRFKREGVRYGLKEAGILLATGEKLLFYVYDSDIDIVKTEIRLMCDIFVKDEGAKS